jgi:hypothetical protein
MSLVRCLTAPPRYGCWTGALQPSLVSTPHSSGLISIAVRRRVGAVCLVRGQGSSDSPKANQFPKSIRGCPETRCPGAGVCPSSLFGLSRRITTGKGLASRYVNQFFEIEPCSSGQWSPVDNRVLFDLSVHIHPRGVNGGDEKPCWALRRCGTVLSLRRDPRGRRLVTGPRTVCLYLPQGRPRGPPLTI